jgi:hypothetical protein
VSLSTIQGSIFLDGQCPRNKSTQLKPISAKLFFFLMMMMMMMMNGLIECRATK